MVNHAKVMVEPIRADSLGVGSFFRERGGKMRRGTTPTLTIAVTGLVVTDLKTIKVTFKQNNIEITKNTNEVTVEEEYNTISVPLTQEDTLKFGSGSVSVQVRGLLKDDKTAIASKIKTFPMEKILLDGVIIADEE